MGFAGSQFEGEHLYRKNGTNTTLKYKKDCETQSSMHVNVSTGALADFVAGLLVLFVWPQYEKQQQH